MMFLSCSYNIFLTYTLTPLAFSFSLRTDCRFTSKFSDSKQYSII